MVKLNDAMGKVINKHADEINELSSIARIGNANAKWCKKRIEQISKVWDGVVKFWGTAATAGLAILWIILTRSWYYAGTCTGPDCRFVDCLNYSTVFAGAIVSLILLAAGIALTWWVASKVSIENLCK